MLVERVEPLSLLLATRVLAPRMVSSRLLVSVTTRGLALRLIVLAILVSPTLGSASEHRSRAVALEFQREHPCPSTGPRPMKTSAAIALIAGLLPAVASAAPDNDGHYVGMSRVAQGGYLCPWKNNGDKPANIDIRGGIVTGSPFWTGQVTSTGIRLTNANGNVVNGTILSGFIRATYRGPNCMVSFEWQRFTTTAPKKFDCNNNVIASTVCLDPAKNPFRDKWRPHEDFPVGAPIFMWNEQPPGPANHYGIGPMR